MAEPLDARERAELSALFTELGPDAPTLCEGWTTEDLACHLVARERNPLSGPGILFGGPFERVTDWAMDRERARGYEAVVERVRTGPPKVPFGLPRLREVLNLNEYFVHLEDVRRANGMGPRTDRPDLDAALTAGVRRSAGMMLRRAKLEVELVDHTGATLASRGDRPAKVIGTPQELTLWLNGRTANADVTFDGTDAQLATLWQANLGI